MITESQAMYIQRYSEGHLCNLCCSGKAMSITFSEGISVALGTQHAKRMRHIVIWGLPTLKYFHTLSHKLHDFRGGGGGGGL